MSGFCDTIRLRNELSQCRKQNKLLIAGNEKCQEQLEIIGNDYSEMLDKLGDSNRKILQLTEGPGPPVIESLRVVSIQILHQLFIDRLGHA